MWTGPETTLHYLGAFMRKGFTTSFPVRSTLGNSSAADELRF